MTKHRRCGCCGETEQSTVRFTKNGYARVTAVAEHLEQLRGSASAMNVQALYHTVD